VIPILTETETKDLIRWHKSHTHLQSVGSKQDYMGVRKMHIQNEYIRTLFQKVENHCLGEIFKATGKVYYAEMSSITSWHNGGYQNPHLDTYSHQETAGKSESEIQNMNDGKPSREWTCIVYLNEDFSGGETYFPPSDYYPFGHQTEPKAGSGLLFQGIHHAHGVFKVRRGQRHTIAIWFTEDQQKCAPTTYSTNLDLNENTIKEHLQYDLRDQLAHPENHKFWYDKNAYQQWVTQAKKITS